MGGLSGMAWFTLRSRFLADASGGVYALTLHRASRKSTRRRIGLRDA